MKIIAKPNVVDPDMIELYSFNRKYMIAIVHIDNFYTEPAINHALKTGKELTLTIGIADE